MDEDQAHRESEAASGMGQQSDHQDRVLAAPVLRFDLKAQIVQLQRRGQYESGAPSGETLVKEPDLRIVLMALRSGGRMEKHQASGPVSIQSIEGRFRVRLPSGTVELEPGELLALEPGIPHDVEAIEDTAFLLTLGRTRYEHVSDRHEPKTS
jgi:quercetin dioxygenase-like cupin family protein